MTLLQQPTNTARDAVATMFGLAGIGRKAGASDRKSSSRCDFGAGRASSWPWRRRCGEEVETGVAAAEGLATAGVAAAIVERECAERGERRADFSSLLL